MFGFGQGIAYVLTVSCVINASTISIHLEIKNDYMLLLGIWFLLEILSMG